MDSRKSGTADPTDATSSQSRVRSRWTSIIAREVRSRPMAYIVFASFTVAGPFVVSWMFPEAHPLIGLIGGVCFGAYAALCTVPQKFL